ncbi:MAG TPA: hypothetical protein VHM19_02315 [Polyangiales bacterium]|nr:hypothetical protein [Polyangiales bacterium]
MTLSLVVSASWPASLAFAEALVSVQLKDPQGKPADGKVELSDAAGKVVATCDAHGGQCEMKDVPGGLLTVTVKPEKGAAPKPKKVMIPPSGKVSLVVATG